MFSKSTTLYIALLSGLVLINGCATNDRVIEENTTLPIQYGAQSQVDTRINDDVSDIKAAATESAAPNAGETGSSPLEVPQSLDNYRIGPEDVVEIQVFGVEELTQTVRVNSAGYISLPLIGQVKAAGLSSEQLAEVIEAKLAKDYLQDPQVSVFIKEFFGQRVTVAGAIENAGVYALRGPATLVQVIAMAGGLGQQALPEEVKVFRVVNGERQMLTFNLNKIGNGEVPDPSVLGNDYIIIPRSGARAFVTDSLFSDTLGLLNPFRWFFL